MHKVLIIGAGNISSGYDNNESTVFLTHAHAFVTHPSFELIGFVDIDQLKGRSAAEKWDTKCYLSVEEAFKSCPDIGIVSIAVPDEFHFSVLKQVANYKPKLVFTEKPLTETLEQACIIEKLYSDYNIPLLINFKRAFVPEIIEILEKVKLNEFGEFKSCFGFYNRGFKHNGSHLIDLIIRFTGCKKLKLLSVVDYLSDFSDSDLSYSFVAYTDKDATINIKSFCGEDYPIFELDLHFNSGRIRIFNTGEKIEIYRVQESSIFTGFKFLQPKYVIDTNLHKSMLFAVNNIHDFLTIGKPLAAPIADGIQVMQITDQILNEIKNKACQN